MMIKRASVIRLAGSPSGGHFEVVGTKKSLTKRAKNQRHLFNLTHKLPAQRLSIKLIYMNIQQSKKTVKGLLLELVT